MVALVALHALQARQLDFEGHRDPTFGTNEWHRARRNHDEKSRFHNAPSWGEPAAASQYEGRGGHEANNVPPGYPAAHSRDSRGFEGQWRPAAVAIGQLRIQALTQGFVGCSRDAPLPPAKTGTTLFRPDP